MDDMTVNSRLNEGKSTRKLGHLSFYFFVDIRRALREADGLIDCDLDVRDIRR
jgi:hypothetical protein